MTEGRLRIDKWLWFARFAKTRTMAQKLVQSGRVRINRRKSDDPAHPVRVGDVLTVAFDSGVRVLRVLGLGIRRGPAPEARTLYEEILSPSTSRFHGTEAFGDDFSSDED